jgi:hypothetical protein
MYRAEGSAQRRTTGILASQAGMPGPTEPPTADPAGGSHGVVRITLLAVHTAKRHAHLRHDHGLSGPQSFHATPVLRNGGLGIVASQAEAKGDDAQ